MAGLFLSGRVRGSPQAKAFSLNRFKADPWQLARTNRAKTEMKSTTKPGILAGALVGAMLTIALVAVFYAAWKIAGLPFVPFDVFDWMTRVLPGRVLTLGIDVMVTVIRGL